MTKKTHKRIAWAMFIAAVGLIIWLNSWIWWYPHLGETTTPVVILLAAGIAGIADVGAIIAGVIYVLRHAFDMCI
jgi:hypothetical protein